MGDYTKLNLDDAKSIFSLFQDEEILSIEPLSLGISNSNYKLIGKEHNYLLKVSNDKNISQLKGEMEILHYLQLEKYLYSLNPYPLKNHEFVYEYKEFFGVLFPFIDGIPPGPSDHTCNEIGKGLAKLHLVKTNSSLRNQNEVGFGVEEIFNYVNSSSVEQDFKTCFNDLLPNGVRYFLDRKNESIVHGDLYYDNTLFLNQDLAVVLDFEQGGLGDPLLDLGISISGTCLEKGRIHPMLVNSYLVGYEDFKPLDKEEKEHLRDAIILGFLSISLWRIHRFKLKNLNPHMTDSYKDLISRAYLCDQILKD